MNTVLLQELLALEKHNQVWNIIGRSADVLVLILLLLIYRLLIEVHLCAKAIAHQLADAKEEPAECQASGLDRHSSSTVPARHGGATLPRMG